MFDTDATRLTPSTSVACDPQTRITRSLLGYGVIAGPVYTLVSVAQALTRPGFDLRRHQWSLLENGDLGWIQVTNFLLTGAMLVAYAVGLGRALTAGPGRRWAPALTATFGICLVAAGIFTADPAAGFPVGTPDGPGTISPHGVLHFAAAGVGFVAIAASCFVLGRRYGLQGRRRFAVFSRCTGLVFLAGFACVASGGGSEVANLIFVLAVVALWSWVTAVALDLYRSVRPTLA